MDQTKQDQLELRCTNNCGTSSNIAIVGMACVYPDAQSPEALWQNILAGRRAFRKAPKERLPRNLYYDPDPEASDRTYSDKMAVLTDWRFDHAYFGIPPVTIEVTDPTHWLALATAEEALAEAGIDFDVLERESVGVILGNSLGGEFGRSTVLRYRWPYVERAIRTALRKSEDIDAGEGESLLNEIRAQYLSRLPNTTEDSLAGAMSNTIAGRICNYFDLGGGGFTIDGACSSSLLAVAHGCDALVNGRLDAVIAGGVDVSLDPFELIGFAKTQALARDDIRPYDERAAGMLPGEGCGIVVLMREEIARNLGCHIHALIRGWGVSSDGRGGITAPKKDGQMRALRTAYKKAGYSIASIGLLEGHGTGTTKGDRVELEAIQGLIAEAKENTEIRIGSIKGNIGHCKAAAGMAGLIKTILALQKKIIPPTIACEHPNKLFYTGSGALLPALTGKIWHKGSLPRRASVSAFGFGGSNAHVTLEEANPEDMADESDLQLLSTPQQVELVFISAKNRQDLVAKLIEIKKFADRISIAELTDLAAFLAEQDDGHVMRVAIVTATPWGLVAALDKIIPGLKKGKKISKLGDANAGIYIGRKKPGAHPKLAAVFPGQGAQRAGMGGDYIRRFPFVKEFLVTVDKAVSDVMPSGVLNWLDRDVISAEQRMLRVWEAEIHETELAQPTIVATSLAIYRVLEYFNLHADIMIGHSLGEISALSCAGCFEPEKAVWMAAKRGLLMSHDNEDGTGAMLAIKSSADDCNELIAEFGSELNIANYNSPIQTVVSGSKDAVEKLAQMCRLRKIPAHVLNVSNAFHSAGMSKAAEEFRKLTLQLVTNKPKTRLISSVTGKCVKAGENLRQLLTDQITRPVRFQEAIEKASESEPAIWVEVGPGQALSGLIRQTLGDKANVVSTNIDGTNGVNQLLSLLANAYAQGFPVDAKRIADFRFYQPIDPRRYNPKLLVNPCEGSVKQKNVPGKHGVSASSETNIDPYSKLLKFTVRWIRERTGHPEEMITEDKRLRDDLNIDSLKAMELIQSMLEKLDRSTMPAAGWENLPVGELVQTVLDAQSDSKDKNTYDNRNLNSRLNGIPYGGGWVESFEVSTEPFPVELEEKVETQDQPSVLIISKQKNSKTRSIERILESNKLCATRVGFRSLLRIKPLDSPNVIIWDLQSDFNAGLYSGGVDGDFDKNFTEQALDVFTISKWLIQVLQAQSATRIRFIVIRASGNSQQADVLDAGAGFLKSLRLEYPNLTAKWIRVPIAISNDKYGQIVFDEMSHGGERITYCYDSDFTRKTEQATLPSTTRQPLAITSEDVIVATGGTGGITLEILSRALRGTDAAVALIGTRPVDNEDVQKNCNILKKLGHRTQYFQCDITEPDRVKATLLAIRQLFGDISIVIHGAGISIPCLFKDMTEDAYLKCIRVKALGLQNVLENISLERLRALHVLSSVLGVTGMARQVDYAFANAWMDGAICSLQAEHPDIQALSMAYSLWKDTGLGKKLNNEDALCELGVTPIPIAEGTKHYLAALNGEGEGPRIVTTGRLPPSLERVLHIPARSNRLFFLERPLRWIPGVEIIAETTLSTKSHHYLRDHIVDGTIVFPAVMGIEAFIQAAQVCCQTSSVPAISGLRFRAPVVIPNEGEMRIRVYAIRDPACVDSKQCYLSMRAESDGFLEDKFVATADFNNIQTPVMVEPLVYASMPTRKFDYKNYTPAPVFHGPYFRKITGLSKLSKGVECITNIDISKIDSGIDGIKKTDLRSVFPAARDSFFQTLLLLSDRLGLPTCIDNFQMFNSLYDYDTLSCRAVLRNKNRAGLVFDIDVFSPDGKLVEILHGVQVESTNSRVKTGMISLSDFQTQTASMSKDTQYAVAYAGHYDGTVENRTVIRQSSLNAVRKAARRYAKKYHDSMLNPKDINIAHKESGQPYLTISTPGNKFVQESNVSISDTRGISIAIIAASPVGIDIEPIEKRDQKLWEKLLGPAGYILALKIACDTGEPISVSATRVWTIRESFIKANMTSLEELNLFNANYKGPWYVFASKKYNNIHILSVRVDGPGYGYAVAIVTGLDISKKIKGGKHTKSKVNV